MNLLKEDKILLKVVDFHGYISKTDLDDINKELHKRKCQVELCYIGGFEEIPLIDFAIEVHQVYYDVGVGILSALIYDFLKFICKKIILSRKKNNIIVDISYCGKKTTLELDENMSEKKMLKRIKKVLMPQGHEKNSDFNPKG